MYRAREIHEWNRAAKLIHTLAGDKHTSWFDVHPYGNELRAALRDEDEHDTRSREQIRSEVRAFLGGLT